MFGVLNQGRGLEGPPVVIKLGGAAIDGQIEAPGLFATLVELHEALPGGIVLVHGGGASVDRHLQRLGVTSQRRDGIRVTPAEDIDDVVAVLAGTVNKRIVGKLQRHGARAVGLCLADGMLARTMIATGHDFDPGRVGEVRGGRAQLVHTLLRDGFMPVLCSIGLDGDGAALNINADDAAAGVAEIVGAGQVVFLTDVPGVLDDEGRLVDELDPAGIQAWIDSGRIAGGMIAKVRSAARIACTAALPVTIASWQDPAALRGLLRGEPVGTRIPPSGAGRRRPAPPVEITGPAPRREAQWLGELLSM